MVEPALKQALFTYEEYLAVEAASPERHIYWDGEIYAMAGASVWHTTLETNLVGLLGTALKGGPCRPLVGNQRLRAPDSDRAVYADATVVCGPPVMHPQDRDALSNPTVIVEVLSKSTEAFDRGDKFTYYRSFPTLRVVVLVSQKAERVECYRRGERGVWSLHDLGADDVLDLPEVGASVALRDLYAGTEDLDLA